MRSRLLLALALTACVATWKAASAEDAECVATCTQQEEQCSADAERAIYDGQFSGHDCDGYDQCAQKIESCRAELESCKARCG